MMMIDSIDFEVDFHLYRVTLYRGGRADVFTHKNSRNGKSYLSAIKPGSQNHKKIMRELRKLAQPGGLLADQIAQHDGVG